MKSKFAGFYNYTQSELRELLSNSIITLDYSLLLDINKLSHGRLLLEMLEDKKFKDRLWLPYDTAWMYHQKLQESIEKQINRVDTAKKHLTSFKSAVEDTMNHPYIGEDLANKYNLLMNVTVKALDKEAKYLNSTLFGSDIRKKILDLFEKKVGEEYNKADLERICDEAEKMAAESIPPCVKPITSSNPREQYHYYIIWKQMQKQVLENDKRSVVFLTNKLSANWFIYYQSTVCTTNPFLRTEFEKVTKKSFFGMSAYLFVRKFKPQNKKEQEYDKLLTQLHKKPLDSQGDAVGVANNQL